MSRPLAHTPNIISTPSESCGRHTHTHQEMTPRQFRRQRAAGTSGKWTRLWQRAGKAGRWWVESGVWCAYLGCAGCGGGGEGLKAERLAGRMQQWEAREMVDETQQWRSSPHKERWAGTTSRALPDENRKFCPVSQMNDSWGINTTGYRRHLVEHSAAFHGSIPTVNCTLESFPCIVSWFLNYQLSCSAASCDHLLLRGDVHPSRLITGCYNNASRTSCCSAWQWLLTNMVLRNTSDSPSNALNGQGQFGFGADWRADGKWLSANVSATHGNPSNMRHHLISSYNIYLRLLDKLVI